MELNKVVVVYHSCTAHMAGSHITAICSAVCDVLVTCGARIALHTLTVEASLYIL